MRPKKVGKVPRPSCSCGPFSRETRGVEFRETMASEAAAARARDLHASISRLLELPARALILPGHVSEPIPFDGQLLGSQFGEKIGRASCRGRVRSRDAAGVCGGR